MNSEILSIETAKKLRDYELLKNFIKKEIERETYLSVEKVTRFIELLEEKEKEDNE